MILFYFIINFFLLICVINSNEILSSTDKLYDDLECGKSTNNSSQWCTFFSNKLECYSELNIVNTSNIKIIQEISLYNYHSTRFDPVGLILFPKLKSLQILCGNIIYITKDFPKIYNLEKIRISRTKLGFLRPTLFDKLVNLKILDLRNNQLDHMESPLILLSNFQKLYLSGNPWNCSTNMRWMINSQNTQNIVDKDILQCSDNKYNSRPIITVMTFQQNLIDDCKNEEVKNCSCMVSYISPNGNEFFPINIVNCSNRNFLNLPSYLPAYTKTLHLEHNKITDLVVMREKKFYRNVQDIYLDYNQIESIEILEAGFWLEHFRVFSIRGNKLKKLPIYALRNALERNDDVLQIYLSNNPWRCECGSFPKFQEFLQAYDTYIKDISNITCSYVEGDDLFGRQVLSLKIREVCKFPKEYTVQPIDLLNGILASLIVLTLGKLGFDYYRYKRYGKVPWLVSKMP